MSIHVLRRPTHDFLHGTYSVPLPPHPSFDWFIRRLRVRNERRLLDEDGKHLRCVRLSQCPVY